MIHHFLNHEIFKCDSCNYSFVDCTNLCADIILKDQIKGSLTFGKNHSRNNYYLNRLHDIFLKYTIDSILEIGTPSDFNFLKLVHDAYPSIILFSHDIIINSLPDYITPIQSLRSIEDKKIDLLFCIHTLEHIPTSNLISFISECERVSKYFIFEVPNCPTLNRVKESSMSTPHYSFFTKQSLSKLFSQPLTFEVEEKIIRFKNF
jgi:hypothetical protein